MLSMALKTKPRFLEKISQRRSACSRTSEACQRAARGACRRSLPRTPGGPRVLLFKNSGSMPAAEHSTAGAYHVVKPKWNVALKRHLSFLSTYHVSAPAGTLGPMVLRSID